MADIVVVVNDHNSSNNLTDNVHSVEEIFNWRGFKGAVTVYICYLESFWQLQPVVCFYANRQPVELRVTRHILDPISASVYYSTTVQHRDKLSKSNCI